MVEKVIHGNSEADGLPEIVLQKQAMHCIVHLPQLWEGEYCTFVCVKTTAVCLFPHSQMLHGKGLKWAMPPEHLQVLDEEQLGNSAPQSQTLARGTVESSHVTQGQVTVKGKEDERQKEVPMSMTREQRDHEHIKGLRESENENQTGLEQHI